MGQLSVVSYDYSGAPSVLWGGTFRTVRVERS